jgi:hypothetical protein
MFCIQSLSNAGLELQIIFGFLVLRLAQRSVRVPDLSDHLERCLAAESKEFAIPTATPTLYRSSMSVKLFGLHLQKPKRYIVEIQVIVDLREK